VTHVEKILRLFADIAIVPTVDLESAVAQLVTLQRKSSKSFLAVEAPVAIAMIGAGIRWQAFSVGAE